MKEDENEENRREIQKKYKGMEEKESLYLHLHPGA